MTSLPHPATPSYRKWLSNSSDPCIVHSQILLQLNASKLSCCFFYLNLLLFLLYPSSLKKKISIYLHFYHIYPPTSFIFQVVQRWLPMMTGSSTSFLLLKQAFWDTNGELIASGAQPLSLAMAICCTILRVIENPSMLFSPLIGRASRTFSVVNLFPFCALLIRCQALSTVSPYRILPVGTDLLSWTLLEYYMY